MCYYNIIYIDGKVLCILNAAVLNTFPHYDTSSQLDMICHVTATVTERRRSLGCAIFKLQNCENQKHIFHVLCEIYEINVAMMLVVICG